MSTISKVFTVLNLVFSLIMVGTVGSILSKSEDFKKKYDDEVVAHAKTVTDKDAVIAAATGDKSNFESQNRTLSNQLADMRSELGTAQSAHTALNGTFEKLKNDYTALSNDLAALQKHTTDTDARNKELMESEAAARTAAAQAEKDKLDAQDDRARIEGDLKRANEDIAAKEAQIVALNGENGNLQAERAALVSAGIDIPALVGNAVPEINGKVSAVGPGFVVLSVGATEKVSVGTPFHVYRGNEYVGRVIVENVLPDSSTARVTLASGAKFMAGDTATTRL